MNWRIRNSPNEDHNPVTMMPLKWLDIFKSAMVM